MLDVSNCIAKTEKNRQRLKIVCKYKTVERAFKEIRASEYGKDLIVEIREGNNIVVFAGNPLFGLFKSSSRCPVSKGDSSKEDSPKEDSDKEDGSKEVYISKKRKKYALLRVLKYKFKNVDINKEISEALTTGEMCSIEQTVIKQELKQSRAFLVNSSSYQNYKVYEYEYDLLKFNDEVDFGDICFDIENETIRADLFCFSNDVEDIIRTYDKALLLLEALKHIDYKNSKGYKIKINYAVITLDSVDIRDYIYKLGKSYRYYNLDIMKNYSYDLKLGNVRERQWFFRIYRYTVEGDTNFILFSDATGKFVEYGKRY